jgi:hypothetical protein
MSSNIYGVGLNHVGAYQVSGRPFVKAVTAPALSADPATVLKVEFPYVTSWISFENAASHHVRFGFSAEGVANNGTGNYSILHEDNHTSPAGPFHVKCKEIYIMCDSNHTASVHIFAGLTNIPASRMYELTGPGIDE